MKKLKRNMAITMIPSNDKRFTIKDNTGTEQKDPYDDYHIYFRDVVFDDNGFANAIYLGETDGVLLDGYCRQVDFSNETGWMNEDGEKMTSVKLASINNGGGMMIILK